jgi:hypothetical protein
MRNRILAMGLLLAAGTAWAGTVPQIPIPKPIEKVPAQPSLTPIPAQDAHLLRKVHGFVWGDPKAPAKAMIFFDPNCIWCHRFYEQVRAGVKAGKARYLMVPVAILKPSSVPKAERILQAKDPEAVFLRDERGFDTGTEEGGLPKTFPAVRKASMDILDINTAVLADLEGGKPATPTLVVFTPHGPALHEGFVSAPTYAPQVPVPPVRHIVMPPVPPVQE